MLLKQIFSYV